jgi:hypothetical protein
VCVCVVCVPFVHLFQDDLRCLFIPHQVNHGGAQKPPAQVSLYKSKVDIIPCLTADKVDIIPCLTAYCSGWSKRGTRICPWYLIKECDTR